MVGADVSIKPSSLRPSIEVSWNTRGAMKAIFVIAAVISALVTAAFVLIGVNIFQNSESAIHEILAMVSFCVAGLGWLSTITALAACRDHSGEQP